MLGRRAREPVAHEQHRRRELRAEQPRPQRHLGQVQPGQRAVSETEPAQSRLAPAARGEDGAVDAGESVHSTEPHDRVAHARPYRIVTLRWSAPAPFTETLSVRRSVFAFALASRRDVARDGLSRSESSLPAVQLRRRAATCGSGASAAWRPCS